MAASKKAPEPPAEPITIGKALCMTGRAWLIGAPKIVWSLIKFVVGVMVVIVTAVVSSAQDLGF